MGLSAGLLEPVTMAALIACVVLVVVAIVLARKASRLESAVAASARELAAAHRAAAQTEQDKAFLTSFIQDFPHSARDLHTEAGERMIPGFLLNIVVRALAPQSALVLIRRHPSPGEDERERVLLVAAAAPAGIVPQGTAATIGEGEIGFVAEVQMAMSRADFETQTAVIRARLRQSALFGFEVDVAAPMVFAGRTLGVLAVSRPQKGGAEAKSVLRLIGAVGGLALHNAATFGRMKGSAEMDGLTDLFNKTYTSRALSDGILDAQRRLQPFSIFLFDIDNFKNYNDVNGHLAGDQLLRLLAQFVRDNFRKENKVGRFGGEEFLALFPGMGAEMALGIADKLREKIAAHPFPHAGGQPLGMLTISGGVAEYPNDARDSAELLRAADKALYEAKRQGRNRVLRAPTGYLGGEEAQQPASDTRED